MTGRSALGRVGPHSELAELREQVRRLTKINSALIDRVERSTDIQGGAFTMFETAITLESLVRQRTTALEDALARLNAANAKLESANRETGAARNRLRDAIESLTDGFALFDADDRMVMCNEAFLGFYPELVELRDRNPTFLEIIEVIAGSGRTIGSLISPDRWIADRLARHARADGAHIQALSDGRWVQISELHTSEGGTVGIYTDVTEVKAQDARDRARELAEKSAILQSTLDTIRLGVAVYDAHRSLIAWNGSLLRTLSLSEDEFSRVLTHAGMIEICEKANGPFGPDRPFEWLAQGSPDVVALRRQKDGRVIEVRRATMPDGGMVMTFEDVSERIEASQVLERRVAERTTELEAEVEERRAVEAQLIAAKTAAEIANRSKTSFIAGASHDLLQPLNAARLFVSALSDRHLPDDVRSLLDQAGVALDSVEDLLEALFEISRLDAGAIEPETGAIALDRILSALRIEFAPLAASAGLTLEIPDTGLWVESDVRMLRRVLQNIVSNAIHYTVKGSVSIAAELIGEDVVIAIRDTGPGIPPEKRELVFEEFRRLEGNNRKPGKGLGLSIVRRTCAMLGHDLQLRSTVGEGSTFVLRLPRAEPGQSAAEDAACAPPGPMA
ncbi:MAG: PAS-domain containing protein, partial [Novosphingobium sp.]|nr:PAS-domain containing protein [Novosphingobium sp.]